MGTRPENTQHNVTSGQPHQTLRHMKKSSPDWKEMYFGHFFSWIQRVCFYCLVGKNKTKHFRTCQYERFIALKIFFKFCYFSILLLFKLYYWKIFSSLLVELRASRNRTLIVLFLVTRLLFPFSWKKGNLENKDALENSPPVWWEREWNIFQIFSNFAFWLWPSSVFWLLSSQVAM